MLTRQRFAGLLTLAVALAAGGASALGQVRQVQMNNPMDANPQVGSGGSNQPVAGYAPINGNAYYTGNVSGLKYFHGDVQYTDPYSFRGTLGSASLNSFYRQAAGAPLGSGTYTGQVQPYYNPSALTSGESGALVFAPSVSGVNSRYVPGTAISALAPNQQPIQSLGTPILSTLNAELPYRTYQNLVQQSANAELAGPSGLFGFRRSEVMAPPAVGLVLPATTQPSLPARPGATTQPGETPIRTDVGVEEQVRGGTGYKPVRAGVPGRIDAEPADALVNRTSKPEEVNDVYRSLLQQLASAQGTETPGSTGAQAARPGSTTQPGARPGRPGATPGTGPEWMPGREPEAFQSTDPTLPNYRPRDLRAKLPRSPSVFEQPDKTLQAGKAIKPVETFAGKSQNPFDTYMKLGEEQLREGRYLDAADTYQSASQMEPNNALPIVGRVHAELGAGLYANAATDLQYLFERKPEMIAVRYKLRSFLPERRIKWIREDLERLAHGKTFNAATQMLLAYMDYQTGNADGLKYDLAFWSEHSPRDRWPAILTKAWLGGEKKTGGTGKGDAGGENQ